MGQKLNVEDPEQGQAALLQNAAALAQEAFAQETVPEAIQASGEEAGTISAEEVPTEEDNMVALEQPQEIPFTPTRGILQAPSVMRRSNAGMTYDQDRGVGLLWDVMATQNGSPLTRAIAKSLSGVD